MMNYRHRRKRNNFIFNRLGACGRVEVEVEDVFAARGGNATGEVGVEAVGGDSKGEVVVFTVDRES